MISVDCGFGNGLTILFEIIFKNQKFKWRLILIGNVRFNLNYSLTAFIFSKSKCDRMLEFKDCCIYGIVTMHVQYVTKFL
jgi:hypothetical protein